MSNLLRDARYATRLLKKHRGFSASAIVVLALGIGVNTAVFSVVKAVLLTPLPYRDAVRLVRLYDSLPSRNLTYFSVSPENFLDWQRQTTVFETMASYDSQRAATLTGDADPSVVVVARASAEVFRLLGVRPAKGRVFSKDEETGSAAAVAIVSDSFWRTQLGNDQDAVGRAIDLDGRRVTVIGIMPPLFRLPGNPADVWTPLVFSPGEMGRGSHFLRVLGRVKPGIPIERVRAEMTTIAGRLAEEHPDTNKDWTAAVRTFKDLMIGTDFERALLVLATAVAFVLLIACANVANLLLTRGAGRAKEIAVRLALGASRGRVVGQLLTESVILAAVGGVLGMLLAVWSVDLLRSIAPANIPRLDEIRVGGWVMAFTAGLSIATGLLFGLMPALQTSRAELTSTLHDGAGVSPARQRIRSALVVGEVTLTLVLLIGAGLLIRSFVRLQQIELGFDPADVVTASVSLPPPQYQTRPAAIMDFYDRMLERTRALPFVTNAGVASRVPMISLNSAATFARDGREQEDRDTKPSASYRIVAGDYFGAMRIPLLRGRTFEPGDRQGTLDVVVISQLAATRYWPDTDPIGKRLFFGGNLRRAFTIVGVVGNARFFSVEDEADSTLYFPLAQSPQSGLTMVVVARTDADAAQMAGALRQIVRDIDARQPIGTVRRLEDAVRAVTAERRFNVLLLGIFAAVALALSVVGIYGVISYAVAARQREIGLRLALGAQVSDILRLIVGQGLRLVALGTLAGVAIAWWVTDAMRGLLFGIEPTDVPTFAAIAIIVIATGLLACYLPARRAMRVDPAVALKAE